MQKRSTTVLLVLLLIVTAGALGFLSWNIISMNETITDMQKEIRDIEVNTAMISSNSQTSPASSKLLTSYKINTSQNINDDGSRNVDVMLTPMEYTSSARISVMIAGKEFSLRKDGNDFSRTCTTTDFLIGDMTVIITDGETVKSEVLTGVIDPVYGPVDGTKTTANLELANDGGSTTVSGEINVVASDVDGVPVAESVMFALKQDNKELFTKKIKNLSTTVSVNENVENTLKGKSQMLLVVEGSDGNRYDYSIPESGVDTTTNYNYSSSITLNKVTDNSGKVIWRFIEGSN